MESCHTSQPKADTSCKDPAISHRRSQHDQVVERADAVPATTPTQAAVHDDVTNNHIAAQFKLCFRAFAAATHGQGSASN